jgi:hypothetical protein
MKNLLLVGILILSIISCKKDLVETMKLDGVWIENSHKADTLIFNTQDSIFSLNRGKELVNGHLLPKELSGPYFYFLKGDSINLIWWASSVGVGKNYHFNLDSKKRQITIGNFFIDSLSNHAVLTFSKME